MSTNPRPADPSAAADAAPDSAAPKTPTPTRDEQRWFSLRAGDRAKEFAANLKANTRRVKQFLHGGK